MHKTIDKGLSGSEEIRRIGDIKVSDDSNLFIDLTVKMCIHSSVHS